MKEKKIARIALDWICIACVIYLLVYGIHNHITTGMPFDVLFNDSIIQWIMWLVWAVWVVRDPVKRIFGGYKEND